MQKYHLIPDGEKWTVTREGPHAPVARFATKRAAVETLTEFLSDREASFKIHKADGSVEEERTYPRRDGMFTPQQGRG